MKTIGIFDVVGPVMVGPSSSHTAGALRIALLARKLCEDRIVRAEFTLYGSFAQTHRGHGTDRALLGGIMGFDTEDPRIPDAHRHAEALGLRYAFHLGKEARDLHPNTVDIDIWGADGAINRVRGASLGGGSVEIRRINGVDIALTGEYPTAVIRHQDRPGALAHIAQCLTDERINIAFLKLYREQKGLTAYAIVETDEPIAAGAVERIRRHGAIESVLLIQ